MEKRALSMKKRVRSCTTHRFREAYAAFPEEARQGALGAYRLFKQNPAFPSLQFKKVDEMNNVYSARVGLRYRSLGVLEGSEFVWFWIGRHSEYDRVI